MKRVIGALIVLGLFSSVALADGKRITVNVVGLHSNAGTVRCALFKSADGFPSAIEKAVAKTDSKIADHKATCSFDGEPAGTYAIGLIHDENDNGKLEKNFLGIPKEGIGSSAEAIGLQSASRSSA